MEIKDCWHCHTVLFLWGKQNKYRRRMQPEKFGKIDKTSQEKFSGYEDYYGSQNTKRGTQVP
jgi:hypothetical protein